MVIREASNEDWEFIWPFFQQITKAGDTYAYEPNTNKNQAKQIWLKAPRKTFVCEDDDQIAGSYYIKTNHFGPGDHVCNCGYMVAVEARGKGLASAMCVHSQQVALELGYSAMQYNFVASSNLGAIRLWKKHGFSEVGRLPNAFNHPKLGYIDALVLFKWIAI